MQQHTRISDRKSDRDLFRYAFTRLKTKKSSCIRYCLRGNKAFCYGKELLTVKIMNNIGIYGTLTGQLFYKYFKTCICIFQNCLSSIAFHLNILLHSPTILITKVCHLTLLCENDCSCSDCDPPHVFLDLLVSVEIFASTQRVPASAYEELNRINIMMAKGVRYF